MANVYADRVQETSTTTGTGTYDLAGAVTGYQGFVAGAGNASTVTYLATDGTDWEVGTGVVTDAATDTLSRASILSSSNAGAAVNWGAGTKTISLTLPASVFDAAANPKYAVISDTKATGTAGGSATSGSWQTRTLQTEDYDPDGIVSISTNQFTLGAGTYHIVASAPAYNCDEHKIRLQNVTDATTDLLGTSAYNFNGNFVQTRSSLNGIITIAATKAFEIQHRVATTHPTNGFGKPSSFSVDEVYTTVRIKQIA